MSRVMLRTTLLDDFALKPMRPPADEDLHELIAERYEAVSTIVTSNLDLSEWDQAFPANRLLASATLDRLHHNAYCLTLDGKSYRTPKMLPSNPSNKLANTSKTRILKPREMSVTPLKNGAYMPKKPGSYTTEGDSIL